MTMRRLVFILLLLLVAAPVDAQRRINHRFRAAPETSIRIQNIAGSVKVRGWAHDSIAVRGVIHERPGEPFKVHSADGIVKIAVWDGASENVPPSDFDIYVPARSQVWIRTASAGIFVNGVTGGVDVSSVGGRIEVAGSPRELIAESMDGELSLDVQTRLLRGKTMTGPIRVRGTISDVSVTSVNGNITVEAIVDRGRFESVDGDVRYIGEPLRTAALDFVNHAGAVDLLLPAATSAAMIVSTHEGAVENEFRVPMRNVGSKLKGSEFQFTLGAGDARINVRTFRGRVIVRRR